MDQRRRQVVVGRPRAVVFLRPGSAAPPVGARRQGMATRARATLDRELGKLQDGLLRLAEMVDAAISRSLQALSSRDVVLAREVVEGHQAVNALRFAIEEECLSLIATQQPAAGDLRAVLAAMNIVSDMERMADHAAGKARIVLRMGDEPLLKPLIDIPRMAETCRGMLRRALDSYVARDVELAKAVAREEDLPDNLPHQTFTELLSVM